MRNIAVLLIVMVILGPLCTASAQSFRVGKGDLLSIKVYEHQDLTMNARVTADGTIKMPFIGSVKVSGMTAEEISEHLMNQYVEEEYLVNPQINVFIDEYRSRKANILGQVSTPGQYEIDEDTSIMVLVTMASGFTRRAYKKSAQVIRLVDGQKEILEEIDMGEKVIPGDIIVIQESFF
ncbi:polysaccharide biosynthesis/export family protein [Desulfoluna limicola]|uniref:polysaccharide biosynthesis/export family protein n=1 Tax=Desulfoluna limicola TaxID=2810562 RepID=UPI001F46A23D|nr:polysaccharide biosynthesis/export family protein [Desulfoluna limicola]